MTAPKILTVGRKRASVTISTLLISLLIWLPPRTWAQQSPKPADERPELALQIGHRSFIYQVAVTQDGKTAASLSEDGTLKIWDAQTADLIDTFAFPKGREIGFNPGRMTFSADGRTIEFLNPGIGRVEKTTKVSEYSIETRKFREFPPVSASLCPPQAELVMTAPDGKTAICKKFSETSSAMAGAEFFLFDTQTNRKAMIAIDSDFPAFEFSPDGRMIAIFSGQSGAGLALWDVSRQQIKRQFDNTSFRGFSTDSQTIVLQIESTGRCDCNVNDRLQLSDKQKYGAVELWDTQLKTPKRTFIGKEFFDHSPDGRTIMLLKRSEAATVAILELWDAQLSALKQTLTGNLPSFSQPIFSPDGRMMALPSESNLSDQIDRTEIILYDMQTGKIINRLSVGSISSEKIAFSLDGSTLTALNWNGEAKVWETKTGALKSTLKMGQHRPKEVAFSDDGQVVVSGGDDGGVVIWNFRTGQIIRTVVFPQHVAHPSFFADDRTIIHAETGLPAMVWDLRNLQASIYEQDDSQKKIDKQYEMRSPDGRLSVKLNSDGKSATLYETQTGKTINTLAGHTGAITSVLFAPDGLSVATVSGLPAFNDSSKAMLALATVFAGDKKPEIDAELSRMTGDRTIKLWESLTGRLKQTLECDGAIHEARLLPDGSSIVATHSRTTKTEELLAGPNSFTLWDTQSGKVIKTLNAEANGSFMLSPDGSLVTTSGPENVRTWDVRTGELKWETSDVEISILGNPFSPDGKLLVAETKYQDSNSATKLLDAQTGKVRWSLPDRGITSFSPDGQTLVCYRANTASFWDLGTGTRRWSIETAEKLNFQSPLFAGGKLAATFGKQYTLELRDARDGRLLVSLLNLPGVGRPNDKGEVTPEWIAFTPEGYYSASPGADRYIRWRLGDKVLSAEAYAKEFNRPDLVQKALSK